MNYQVCRKEDYGNDRGIRLDVWIPNDDETLAVIDTLATVYADYARLVIYVYTDPRDLIRHSWRTCATRRDGESMIGIAERDDEVKRQLWAEFCE